MYNTSEAYKRKIAEPSRVCEWYGNIVTVATPTYPSTTFNFTNSDIVQGSSMITRESASGDKMEIGTTNAAQLDLGLYLEYNHGAYILDGKTIDTNIFYDATITIYFRLWLTDSTYEDVPCGIFRVSEPKRTTTMLTLIGYDDMLKFDKEVDVSAFPSDGAVAYEWLQVACTACGVDMGQTRQEIGNFVNSDVVLTLYDESKVDSWRAVIGYISACLGTFCYVGRDSKLYLRMYMSDAKEFTARDRYGSETMDYVSRYNCLMAYHEETKTDEFYELSKVDSASGLVYNFGDNPFAQIEDDDDRETFFVGIRNILNYGVSMKASANVPSDPSYDPGDFVQLTGDHIVPDTTSAVTQLTVNIGGAMDVKCAGENPYTQKIKGRIGSAVDNLEKKTEEGEGGGPTGFTLHDVLALSNLKANDQVYVIKQRRFEDYYKFSSPSPSDNEPFKANFAFDDKGNVYFISNSKIYKKDISDPTDTSAAEVYPDDSYTAVDIDREIIIYKNDNLYIIENIVTGMSLRLPVGNITQMSIYTSNADKYSQNYFVLYTLNNGTGSYNVFNRAGLNPIRQNINNSEVPYRDGTYGIIASMGSSRVYSIYHNGTLDRTVNCDFYLNFAHDQLVTDDVIFCIKQTSFGYVKIGYGNFIPIFNVEDATISGARFDSTNKKVMVAVVVGDKRYYYIIDIEKLKVDDIIDGGTAISPSSPNEIMDFVKKDDNYYYHVTNSANKNTVYRDEIGYAADTTENLSSGDYYGYVKKAIKKDAKGDVEVLIETDNLDVHENGTYTAESGHLYDEVYVNVAEPKLERLDVNVNGTYVPWDIDGYNMVIVNVPGTDIESLTVTQNGTYTAPEGTAYSPVVVNVPQTQIDALNVTENGTYTAQSGHAYSPVTVNVPETETVQLNVTQNGTYTAPEGQAYDPVVVNVPETDVEALNVTRNGTYAAQSGHAYSPVGVDVPTPNTYGVYAEALESLSKGDTVYTQTRTQLETTPKYTFTSPAPQNNDEWAVDGDGYMYFKSGYYLYRINMESPSSPSIYHSEYTITSLYRGVWVYSDSSSYYVRDMRYNRYATISKSDARNGITVDVLGDYIKVSYLISSSKMRRILYNRRTINQVVLTLDFDKKGGIFGDYPGIGFYKYNNILYSVQPLGTGEEYNIYYYDTSQNEWFEYKNVILNDYIKVDTNMLYATIDGILYCFNSDGDTLGYISIKGEEANMTPIISGVTGLSDCGICVGDSQLNFTVYDKTNKILYRINTYDREIEKVYCDISSVNYNRIFYGSGSESVIWLSPDNLKLRGVESKDIVAKTSVVPDDYNELGYVYQNANAGDRVLVYYLFTKS